MKYTYDDLNRLIKVKGLDGDTTKYSYDELGRRIKTDGSKEDTVYTYDEVGNLVSQTTTGAYDLALEYAYDKSGRMTGESRTENGATVESRYVYDALGQLTGFERSDGYAESYAYDPAGNLTTKTQNGVSTTNTYNAANQLTRSVTNGSTTRYSYDANGNLTAKVGPEGTTAYTYNVLNRLESYTGADGYRESYTYNANGLLSTLTNETGTTSFVWDILYGEGVVLTEETNGTVTAYDYGLERISAITGKYKTEYVHDALGNVAAEVGYNSAWYTLSGLLSKNTVTTKEYTPFGELLTENVSGFGYRGEYYSAETGAVYLRARYYEPELGRFNQKDILRGDISVPTSLNRYAYVRNDPVNFIDPSGMRYTMHADVGGGGVKANKSANSNFASAPKYSKQANSAASSANSAKSAVTGSVGSGALSSSIAAAAGYLAANSKASSSSTPSTPGVTSPVKERKACSKFATFADDALTFMMQSVGPFLKYCGDMWSTAKHLSKADVALGKNLLKINSLLPFVGVGVDLFLQIAGGEKTVSAIIKTSAHAAIGYGLGAIAGAILAAPAIPAELAIAAVAIGAVGTVFAAKCVDWFYDNYLKDLIENFVQKTESAIKDTAEEFFDAMTNFLERISSG